MVMKRSKLRPILMMRYDGGIRIIHPSGRVEWTSYSLEFEDDLAACTTRRSQRAALKACVEYDKNPVDEENFAAILGYL